MMTPQSLHIKLLSDTTFGRGEGTAGVVDVEVEHDRYGIPFIGGKTIRGLLRDSWFSMRSHFPELHAAGDRVFGPTQRFLDDDVCILRIGDAHFETNVRNWILAATTRIGALAPVPAERILAACTDIRFQTSEDRCTGAPAQETLRSTRVVLRRTCFESRLTWNPDVSVNPQDQQVLAMAALSTRHGGLVRNRGRGHLQITLDGNLPETQALAGTTNTEAVS